MLNLEGSHGRVHTLAFSPDGRYLASVSGRSSQIWLWDLMTFECIQKCSYERRITALAFAPDGSSVIACCDSNGSILSYHWEKQRWRVLDRVQPRSGMPVKLVFSANGKWFAATNDQPGPTRSHLGYFYSRHIGGVTVWEWEKGLRLSEGVNFYEHVATSPALSTTGRYVAAGGLQRHISVWERETGELIHNFDHAKKIHFLAWSPDDSTLASATMNGFVKIWDLVQGRKKMSLHTRAKAVQAISYSPDGSMLATADADGLTRFWDVKTGEQRLAFNWEIGAVHSVAFSQDGMRAAAGGDSQIMIWDLEF